jgi:hypothetical protein
MRSNTSIKGRDLNVTQALSDCYNRGIDHPKGKVGVCMYKFSHAVEVGQQQMIDSGFAVHE